MFFLALIFYMQIVYGLIPIKVRISSISFQSNGIQFNFSAIFILMKLRQYFRFDIKITKIEIQQKINFFFFIDQKLKYSFSNDQKILQLISHFIYFILISLLLFIIQSANFNYKLTLRKVIQLRKMNLENQTKTNIFSNPFSNPFSANSLNNIFKPSSESHTLSKIKTDHRNTIRAQQHQRIKAQKRQRNLSNQAIQQILAISFPRQNQDSRTWALQLAKLFQKSNQYRPDAHKLRQIYVLAQKLPNQGTLILFYMAVQNSKPQDLITLKDLDIWRFLHNFLQFPTINKIKLIKNQQNSDQISYSPPSNSSISNGIQAEAKIIKIVIQTFIKLYQKHATFRDYSIVTHATYQNYLLPAYRKYGQSIKTQMIKFYISVFHSQPKKYDNQYNRILSFVICELSLYKEVFQKFFNENNQWKYTKQTINQALERSTLVMKLFTRIFGLSKTNWIRDNIQGKMMNRQYGFLSAIQKYISFGLVLVKSITLDYKTYLQNSSLFYLSVKLLSQSFKFFQTFMDQTIGDGLQNYELIPNILKKAVKILDILKYCQQNKYFIKQNISLTQALLKCKLVIWFILGNQFHQDLNSYTEYFKSIIEFRSNNRSINLFQLTDYFLENEQYSQTTHQTIITIFSYLRLKTQSQDEKNLQILKKMVQKILDMLQDKFTNIQIKTLILVQLDQYFHLNRQKFTDLGYLINIRNIARNKRNAIEQFYMSEQLSFLNNFNMGSLISQLEYNSS